MVLLLFSTYKLCMQSVVKEMSYINLTSKYFVKNQMFKNGIK